RGDRMRRREFIVGVGGTAAWPLSMRAQQQIVPSVGVLGEGPSGGGGAGGAAYAAPVRGVAGTGFVEGRNLGINQRFAEGHVERLPALVGDLVIRNPQVIAAFATNAALAAKAATRTSQSFLTLGATRSRLASLQASIDRAAMSP